MRITWEIDCCSNPAVGGRPLVAEAGIGGVLAVDCDGIARWPHQTQLLQLTSRRVVAADANKMMVDRRPSIQCVHSFIYSINYKCFLSFTI